MTDAPVPANGDGEEEALGLTIAEAAAQLGLHPSTVYRAVIARHLPALTTPAYRWGGPPTTRIYLSPEAVAAFGEWRVRRNRCDRLVTRILRDLAELRDSRTDSDNQEEGYWDDVRERLERIARANRHSRSESHSE